VISTDLVLGHIHVVMQGIT